jgi:glucan phosphoethanolaminetransferase (alkaline phosphatase superfamily)
VRRVIAFIHQHHNIGGSHKFRHTVICATIFVWLIWIIRVEFRLHWLQRLWLKLLAVSAACALSVAVSGPLSVSLSITRPKRWP